MKRKILGTLLLIACMLSQTVCAQDWAKLSRYAEENQVVRDTTQGRVRVVFMGNSITEGWPEKRPDFFTSNGYVGRGISGQTSYQFLLRFRQDVIGLNPRVVVINAGTNDVAENAGPYVEEQTFNNIVSMVELARLHKIKVVLSTVLPAKGFSWRKELTDAPEKISSLNARLRQYAKEQKLPFVDYYTPLVLDESGTMNPAYTTDGVHPTVDGYAVMEPLVQEVLKKLLR